MGNVYGGASQAIAFHPREWILPGTSDSHSLFLTSDYALLVAAHCVDCGGEFHVEIPLEQLIAACPGVPPPAPASAFFTENGEPSVTMHELT